MDLDLPCVLVLGPSGCGRHTFADALAKHLDANHGKSFRSLTPLEGEMFKGASVAIDTRYYTAQVALLMQTEPDAAFPVAQDPVVDAVLERTQAVIYAFDASSPASFEGMRAYVEGLGQRAFETVLCVANKADLVADDCRGEKGERWQEWCRERMVEYVEVDSVRGPGETTQDDREKVNFHRVVEALHVTMWANMERKPVPSRLATGEEGLETQEEVGVGVGGQGVESVEAELPELCTSDKSEKATKDRDDLELDELFQLVNEMKSVRNVANELSDEDRRQAAADMALKLLEKLGLDEE